MGDHRANIKIEFQMYGETAKADMWINWSPDGEVDGLDDRVKDFFVEHYHKARAVYEEEIFEAQREAREREDRRTELALLARLKAKYPEEAGR